MKLTVEQLHVITGNTKYVSRKEALAKFMNNTAAGCSDIMVPHRLAQFLAQTMHESAGLRFVKEVWGPTKAQLRYEGRGDLGNIHKGDGRRFSGRDIIQCTGRSNYRELTKWLRAIDPKCPDFEKDPDALLRPEYLGLSALWYWTTRVPSKYVNAGDIEMVTRRVNGGLNGYADRLRYYDRAALMFLGFEPTDIRGFQESVKISIDGLSGPKTRAAMHDALVKKGQAQQAKAFTTPHAKAKTADKKRRWWPFRARR